VTTLCVSAAASRERPFRALTPPRLSRMRRRYVKYGSSITAAAAPLLVLVAYPEKIPFWTGRGRDPLEVAYATAARRPSASMPRAEIHPGGGGMSSDGVHPNDNGYGVIAAGLRELGYEPLGPS
jgi:hypothetical protein